MKKLLSAILASAMLFAAVSATASAGFTMLDPQVGDISTGSINAYITQTTDSDGFIAGRVIDASSITKTTTVADTSKQTFLYRIATQDAKTEVWTHGGGTSRFKNNFVWQFDFTMDKLPETIGDSGCFYIMPGKSTGNGWANAIKFWTLTPDAYCIRWAGGNPTTTAISGETYSATPDIYQLNAGKTYRLKIEFDARSTTPTVYVTFTNPYITKVGDVVTALDTPDWNNPNIYTKRVACLYPSYLGFSQSTLDAVKTAGTRLDFSMSAKSAMKMTLTNESFYIDKFWNITPEITLDGSTLKAQTNSINITNFNFYTTVPTLVLAVYKENGEFVTFTKKDNQYYGPMNTLTDHIYDTTVDLSELADGTYNVKAFVWNSLGEMQPYNNCLTQKTLTITDGTAVLE